jgi:hypothetical protein
MQAVIIGGDVAMHKVTIVPLGNADCCRIVLKNGKRILFDYADTRDPEDEYDLRCDLPKELRQDLEHEKRTYYDVVAFTHLDEDHYKGASEFFWFDHAEKYQGDDRIKINTLWVPAAIITEKALDKEEARIIQREARYRFKKGKGIRVFSRPERLREWCEENEINLDDRKNIITDAGQLAPEFSKGVDGIEFFVHSPFAKRLNDSEVEDRNDDSLVVQAVFEVDGVETKMLLMADVTHEVITDIVEVTRDKKNRPERLEWDIVELPHHCSYRALGPDKGKDKTEPVENVAWLYEEKGQKRAIIVSTSNPIPIKGSDEDKDDNPPHRQAANYYKNVVSKLEGEFLATMEYPKKAAPKPIVIEIDKSKATLKKTALSGIGAITTSSSPRAG